jgi:N-acetylmuramoyl-L-alanine amidase
MKSPTAIAIAAFVALGLVPGNASERRAYVPVFSRDIESPKTLPVVTHKRPIIIDPGHGGPSPGTTQAAVAEDEITYDISVRVTNMLTEAGYEVHQTVYDKKTKFKPQDMLTNDKNEFLVEKTGKKRPMKKKYLSKRCRIINSLYKGKDPVAVSIHVNATNPLITGASFYYPGAERYGSEEIAKASRKLAHTLEKAFKEREVPTYSLGPIPIRAVFNRFHRGDNWYAAVFKRTSDVKSKVVVETGNAQNKSDAARLVTTEGRQEIAEAIVAGIVSYQVNNH